MELFRMKIGSPPSRRVVVVTGLYRQKWRSWSQLQFWICEGRRDYFEIDYFAVYDASGEITEQLSDVEAEACWFALHARVIDRKRFVEKDTRRMYQILRTLENETRRKNGSIKTASSISKRALPGPTTPALQSNSNAKTQS